MDISKWAFKNRNLVYFLVTVLLPDEQAGRP